MAYCLSDSIFLFLYKCKNILSWATVHGSHTLDYMDKLRWPLDSTRTSLRSNSIQEKGWIHGHWGKSHLPSTMTHSTTCRGLHLDMSFDICRNHVEHTPVRNSGLPQGHTMSATNLAPSYSSNHTLCRPQRHWAAACTDTETSSPFESESWWCFKKKGPFLLMLFIWVLLFQCGNQKNVLICWSWNMPEFCFHFALRLRFCH